MLGGTLCRDPVTGDTRPKNLKEKKEQCFRLCEYYRGRLLLKMTRHGKLVEEGLTGILLHPETCGQDCVDATAELNDVDSATDRYHTQKN